jgi:hypothetical protein
MGIKDAATDKAFLAASFRKLACNNSPQHCHSYHKNYDSIAIIRTMTANSDGDLRHGSYDARVITAPKYKRRSFFTSTITFI